jgi:hypothetical protein
MTTVYEYTHFYDNRQAGWCVYRRRPDSDKRAWVIYMGPFDNEEKAKVKAEWLNVNRRIPEVRNRREA